MPHLEANHVRHYRIKGDKHQWLTLEVSWSQAQAHAYLAVRQPELFPVRYELLSGSPWVLLGSGYKDRFLLLAWRFQNLMLCYSGETACAFAWEVPW